MPTSPEVGPLRPTHAQASANAAILLGREIPLSVNSQRGPTSLSVADVSLTFGSGPQLLIAAHYHPDSAAGAFYELVSEPAQPVVVDLPTLDAKVEVIRTRHDGEIAPQGACFTSEYVPARGAINVRRPGHEDLEQVQFGILNFVDFRSPPADQITTSRPTPGGPKPDHLHQVVLVAAPWRVRVSSLLETKSLVEEARATGGYAVTHAGCASREDAGTFTSTDASELLHALTYYLSFARGFWSPVILPEGTNREGRVAWERWSAQRASSWTNVYHWLDDQHPQWLAEAFPGFMHAWSDSRRRDSLKSALYWYLAANQSSSGVDVCLILSQTALELLAWSLCVVERRLVSAEGFNALRASDKLRMALSSSRVPIDIPVELKDLVGLSARQKWLDGPQAVTEIRNELVHPGKKRRVLPSDGLWQSWQLAQQYVELLILRSIDYRGRFSDRIRHSRIGDESPVPWAK